jgi:hypothetical protein
MVRPPRSWGGGAHAAEKRVKRARGGEAVSGDREPWLRNCVGGGLIVLALLMRREARSGWYRRRMGSA